MVPGPGGIPAVVKLEEVEFTTPELQVQELKESNERLKKQVAQLSAVKTSDVCQVPL